MKKRVLLTTGFIIFLLTAIVNSPSADTYGTELPFVIGTGARASGMGLAYTSLTGDPAVQYFNPASLAEARWKQFQFFRTVLFDSKSLYHTAGYTHPTLNYGTLGVSILRLDIGGVEERDADNQLLSDNLKNSQTRILLGYARKLHPSFSAGINLKIDNQSFGGFSGSGIGLDIGFFSSQLRSERNIFREIREGLVIQNIVEPSVKLDQEGVADPMCVAFGLSALSKFDNIAFTTSIDLINPRFSPFSLRLGQEVQILDYFFLRAGIDKTTPTFGFGGFYRNFTVDYAYRDEDLGSNHRISLSVSLGASTDESRDRARLELEAHINTQITKKMESIEKNQLLSALQHADSLYDVEEYEKAIDSYEIAFYWDPDNEHAHARLIQARYQLFFREGLKRMENEDCLQAIYYFRRALSQVPEDAASMSHIATCEQRLSESRNRTIMADQLLKKAIDMYANQQFNNALIGFDEILKIDPSNQMAEEYKQKTLINMKNIKQRLILQARALSNKQDYEGAIKALEDALIYDKNDPMVVSEIDLLKRKRNEMIEARKLAALEKEKLDKPVVKKSVSLPAKPQIDPNVMEKKYKKGMRHFEGGDFQQATQSFLEIWTIDPEFHNVSTLLTKAYLLMGMQLYSQEQYEEALDIWEKALKVDPHNVKAKRFLMKTKGEMEKLGGVSSG